MVNYSRRLPSGASASASTLVRMLHTEVKWAGPPPLIQEDSLYRRLSVLGRKEGIVASTINKYIREGNPVEKTKLDSIIKELRKHKRYNHALEIMEWMEFRKINFAQRDYGVRLELIGKAKGIVDAENYLSGLSPFAKVSSTYLALLNCYCDKKMKDKAVDLFCQMVKMNIVSSPPPFNNLMYLYFRLKQPQEVIFLGKQMKKMNIEPDTYSCNLLMCSYSYLKDIEGVERVFEEMKRGNPKWCNWACCSTLAKVYIKGGDREKVILALKKLEEWMESNDREAYHFLIRLYAKILDPENVKRIWESLKSTFRALENMSYCIMIQALRQLDDMNGIKKCYKEWESVNSNFDIRLTNTVIRVYLKHDMIGDAVSVLQTALDKSDGPFVKSWELLMIYFLKKCQVKKALQIMEVATSSICDNDKQCPIKRGTVHAFLNYFKKVSDVTSAEEFYKFMKTIDYPEKHTYETFLQTYLAAGGTAPRKWP